MTQFFCYRLCFNFGNFYNYGLLLLVKTLKPRLLCKGKAKINNCCEDSGTCLPKQIEEMLIMVLSTFFFRNSHSEVFLGKGVLKICSKFTGEHPCQSAHFGILKSHFGMGVLL